MPHTKRHLRTTSRRASSHAQHSAPTSSVANRSLPSRSTPRSCDAPSTRAGGHPQHPTPAQRPHPALLLPLCSVHCLSRAAKRLRAVSRASHHARTRGRARHPGPCFHVVGRRLSHARASVPVLHVQRARRCPCAWSRVTSMPAAAHHIPPSLIELQYRATLRIMNLGPEPHPSASGSAPHPARAPAPVPHIGRREQHSAPRGQSPATSRPCLGGCAPHLARAHVSQCRAKGHIEGHAPALSLVHRIHRHPGPAAAARHSCHFA